MVRTYTNHFVDVNEELRLRVARSELDAGLLLDTLALIGEPIRISYLWRPLLADLGDDLVLETAVNGGRRSL